jgi:hypothetical protein
MRPLVQPWTVEDDERLRMFVAQDASLVPAAAAFRRRKEMVRTSGPATAAGGGDLGFD